MDTFKALVKKERDQKYLLVSAIWLDQSVLNQYGSYYHYRFDLKTNTYYINDLNYAGKVKRASVTNIIEKLAFKMMNEQLNFFNGYVKKVLQKKVPKFVYFYHR